MNEFWTYFWPIFAGGLVVGTLAATIGYRRRRFKQALAIGAVTALALMALWHGPLGAADRFAATVDRKVQRTLVYYEITQVRGQVQHGPLTRQVLLSGPADDFQRSELVRLMEDIPGVSKASWSRSWGVPLIAQAALALLLGFLLGLLLAYIVEVRRRYNADYNW
ncbi:MAG TPA: hypothetical protein VIL42_07020 [Sphingomicrobium sp.]|jgi:hypothetical protein